MHVANLFLCFVLVWTLPGFFCGQWACLLPFTDTRSAFVTGPQIPQISLFHVLKFHPELGFKTSTLLREFWDVESVAKFGECFFKFVILFLLRKSF